MSHSLSSIQTNRRIKNAIAKASMIALLALALLPLFSIVYLLLKEGLALLSFDFIMNLPRPAGEAGGGMRHAILGTLMMMTMAGIVSIPLGILAGISLSEFPKEKLTILLKYTIDLLVGVPSIVVGIFSYLLLVVTLKGFSAIAGAFALAIIIMPVVAKSTEEILKMTPSSLREAGLSLGLPRWKVIVHIVLRANIKPIFTGVILGISRASGETAPLLFTAFGNMHTNTDLLLPTASLPVQIYTYAISPFRDWQQQAWTGALLLVIIILTFNLSVRFLLGSNERRMRK